MNLLFINYFLLRLWINWIKKDSKSKIF